MSDSIRLHPKYGVNPTIPTCFWCGKDKNEVALLGAAYKGEAPHRMVLDREPCDDCKAQMAQGVTIAEAREVNGRPVPTGRWVVLKEEAIGRIFQPQSMVEEVLKARKALMDTTAFERLFVAATDAEEPS